MPWFQCQIDLKVVAIGRLQFNTSAQFTCPATVFRSRETGEVRALASGGKRFTAAGILDDLQKDPSEGSWESVLEETETAWKGNPVTLNGFVSGEPVELLKSEWAEALKPGDPVINIHIPESGPLKHQACREALFGARDFFARYLPDYPWKAFMCDSWLLDPQLRAILRPDSNILAFQNMGYQLPYPGAADTIFRCFGVKGARDGVGTVPLRTSLQQTLARFLKEGHRFHYGGMILLREDLERENPYPRHEQQ